MRKTHRCHSPGKLFEINLVLQLQESNIIVGCPLIVTEIGFLDFRTSQSLAAENQDITAIDPYI